LPSNNRTPLISGRYVLARHLKRDEVIHPLTELGKFRGESVYARAAVLTLKTAENWLRGAGRVVKPGCQPMKWVKPRAVTVGRRREIEVAAERSRAAKGEMVGDNAGGGEVMQGLYALSQTELYKPNPVVDVCPVWVLVFSVWYQWLGTGQNSQERFLEHRSVFAVNASERGCSYPV
jgi:Rad4 beta-hairpin domain 2/Rad4 beta-hairpin domain 1